LSSKSAKKRQSKPKGDDPFAQREAEKYANPVPSREYILACLEKLDQAVDSHGLAKHMGVKKSQREAFQYRLRAMQRDGQLFCNQDREYLLPLAEHHVSGTVIAKAGGIGFLALDGGGKDLFIPPPQMRRLMHGDKIEALLVQYKPDSRPEAHLKKVIEHGTNSLVGQLKHKNKHYVVQPDDPRLSFSIDIAKQDLHDAKNNDWVAVRITGYPDQQKYPSGLITKIIGKQKNPALLTDIAIENHQIPTEWSESLQAELKKIPNKVLKKQLKHREDLRALALVTIDGEDARDFDDAVYCEPNGKGWRLIVAIADVANYVKADSELDHNAQQRGTSVYFPDRVVPMLPEKLSNGLCSLKPEVDRLCLACELIVNHHGGIRKQRFFSAVMHSHARLTYTQVDEFLKGKEKAIPNSVQAGIQHLHQLYQLLAKRRKKRGAIEFDSIENRFSFDEKGNINGIYPLIRNDAHRLIEEMMLLANVAAADWLASQEVPFLYRVHPIPGEEKLKNLRNYLKTIGLQLYGKDTPQAKHYSALLEKNHHRPDYQRLQTVLLRSLQVAVYTPDNAGHFGLAYDHYTHFTSPIRRYPDLLTHRAIYHCLQQPKHKQPYRYDSAAMNTFGEQCSHTERRAEDASRDVVSGLKALYMQDKVGEKYDGVIVAVTAFGLFVQLKDILIEGLVHISALGKDYYVFDADQHKLTGQRGGKVYQLSDPMRVQVSRVDVDERKIDLFPLT